MSKISVHHVGGRWGDDSFSKLELFESDLVRVLYEADADAIQTMKEARRETKSELVIVAACLNDGPGDATLNLTLNPGMTSILEPGVAMRKRYKNISGVDCDWQEGATIVDRRTVQTVALDDILADSGAPSPDFLSLDTQGSEHAILTGAANALKSVCGLIVEVEFVEMYRGQKRFIDVLDLLDGAGFSFVRFERMGELGGPKTALGLRGAGCQMWADALFLRRPDTPSSPTQLEKLAFISVVYGHLEFAITCLDQLGLRWRQERRGQRRYVDFLLELFDARSRMKTAMPPSFGDVLPIARAGDYSKASSSSAPEIFDLARFNTPQYYQDLHVLRADNDTEIEAVLRRHRFEDVASRVKHLRREQAGHVEDVVRKHVALTGGSAS
jgi:FkbM family methyltransferase